MLHFTVVEAVAHAIVQIADAGGDIIKARDAMSLGVQSTSRAVYTRIRDFHSTAGCGATGIRQPHALEWDEAEAVVDWARRLEGAGDWATAVRDLVGQRDADESDIGLIVSLVPAYWKWLESLVALKSQHVGSVGERRTFSGVTVVKEDVMPMRVPGRFTSRFTLTDAAGNRLVWFTSIGTLTVGERINIVATVKAHEVFREVKQTVITRGRQLADRVESKEEITC